jgi:hypothetical protein
MSFVPPAEREGAAEAKAESLRAAPEPAVA